MEREKRVINQYNIKGIKKMRNIILLSFLFGCGHNMLKQSPPLAPEEKFYQVDEKVGVVFHRRCEKLSGKDRKCTRTEYRITELWNVLYPSFILIRKDKVFK